MSQVPTWYERKFNFPYPVEFLPNLQARLRGTPARLEDLIRAFSHATLTAEVDGKWSIQEHAGHLLNLEPLWLARVGNYVSGTDQLAVTDLSNRQTDEANYNACPLDAILSEFRAARGNLLNAIDGADSSLYDRAIIHPRLKT